MKIEIDSILESQIRRYERSVIRESGVCGLSIVLSMLVKEMDSKLNKSLNSQSEQKIDYVPYYPSYSSYPGIGYPPQTWYSTSGNTEASLNP